MPYARNEDLPPEVRGAYRSECQSVFRRVWNETYERSGSEGRAFAVAHTAAGRCEESKMAEEPRLKVAQAVDLSLSEDGTVVVAFAVLGDPSDQKEADIDKDGDVSLLGSLPVGKDVPISAYGHSSWPERGARLPVGRGTISETKAKGRNVGVLSGSFLTETTHGRDTYLTVKAMSDLQEWSFGYAVESERGTWAGKPANLNKSYDVHEVSPVLLGAGNGTHTMAVKGDEGPLAGLPLAEHFLRVREDVDGFTSRVREVADLRTKEGRVLSARNRTRITALLESIQAMDDLREDLRRLLEETDPARTEEAAEEGKALEVAFLRTQARISQLIHA